MSLQEHHKFILDAMDRQNAIARNFVAELEAENARLKDEVERLTKAGDALHCFLIGYIVENRLSSSYLNKLDDDWNKALNKNLP